MITKLIDTFSSKNNIYRLIYLLLLGVLLPHTAWAFSKFEPDTSLGISTAWAAAVFFELVIAILTEKLADRISVRIRQRANEKRITFTLRRISFRYGNSYFGGLLLAWVVSSLANFGHAVEFGQDLVVFSAYNISFTVYALAFGAILPTASLLFAGVLSSEHDNEHDANIELERAKAELRKANKEIERANKLNKKFGGIFSNTKKDQIVAIHKAFPSLKNATISQMVGASPSYVSDTLRSSNGKVSSIEVTK